MRKFNMCNSEGYNKVEEIGFVWVKFESGIG